MRFPVLLILTAATAAAQTPDLAKRLSFEEGEPGSAPPQWSGSGHAVLDRDVVHGGKHAVRLVRTDKTPGAAVLTAVLPVEFSGREIELRGWLKLDEITEFAGLWVRADADTGTVGFNNMQAQQVKGTVDWKQYSIRIPLAPEARQLVYGVLFAGTGKLWADDLELLVDGKPVWEAPKAPRATTVLDTDTEFDLGSKISLPELTPVQVDNLVLLGKVWGFAKYHHPRVTAGELHWDYELIRALPKVLSAPDRAAGQHAIQEWLVAYGAPKACDPCAQPPAAEELHLKPDFAWQQKLHPDFQALLAAIYSNRRPGKRQFYAAAGVGAGNVSIEHESVYGKVKAPDPGFQLLAVYRFWNIIEYWFPYRNLIEENWDGVLREFIPRLMRATSQLEYQREMIALIGRVHDTHANLWGGLNAQPPVGDCTLPARFRFVEDRAVVTRAIDSTFQQGDIVEQIDGAAVADLVKQWSPYYPASNEPTRLRDISGKLGNGSCGEAKVRVRRSGESRDLVVTRGHHPRKSGDIYHERPGPALQKLSPEVSYLKMSEVKNSDSIPALLDRMAGSKVLVIDSRSYPGGFTPFTLGAAFVDQTTPFARFTKVEDAGNPGVFHFTKPLELTPRTDVTFKGKVIVLVDEVSQSSSEYQTMAWSAGPRAKVVGSTTAAADGNVSRIPLPFRQSTMISGIGVFYPDKRPTQRVGIPAAIVAKPTIEGIRQGRDEVLERALRDALGPDVPEEEIIRIARPPAQ